MSDSVIHISHILTAKKRYVAERLDTTLVSDQGNRGGVKESLIVTLHSYKGGTGKTLLSVNLAMIFADKGKKSVFVGFRPSSSEPQFNIQEQ